MRVCPGHLRHRVLGQGSNHTVSDSVANSNSLRVDSSALIGHLSHVSVNIVGVVVDVLDAAIRKVDRVGSLPSSSAIVGLESSLRDKNLTARSTLWSFLSIKINSDQDQILE